MRTPTIPSTARRFFAPKPNVGPIPIAGPMTKDVKTASGAIKSKKAGVPMSADGKPPPGGVISHPLKSAGKTVFKPLIKLLEKFPRG
tara:strand:- start:216 stop:476 length:261 start_codon:yes stop_codon:yes gene_type:complete